MNEAWVLEEDGALIGLMQPRGDEINGLWVHPDRQPTGAGTLLLQAGEEIIRRGSHQRAWLTCSGFNGSAIAFYRRCGYQDTQRTRETHGCGVEVEEVRMERLLLDGRREI